MPKIKIELPVGVLNEWARIANERKEPVSKTIADHLCKQVSRPTLHAGDWATLPDITDERVIMLVAACGYDDNPPRA